MLERSTANRRTVLRAAVTMVTAVATVVAFCAVPPLAAPAEAAVLTPDDYCLEQCADILPPGQNGNATLAGILLHQTLGTRPAHSADQLDRYANLVYNYAGLSDEQIGSYFNNASFGVPAGQVERTYKPRSDVTIVRDTATGTPHITGTTRGGTMFGAGYAGAEDRLFTMDLLRHVGRGTLTSFAGGSQGNRDFEQSVWRHAPYTEADLQAQVAALQTAGGRGAQLYADVVSYVAGVNAYIGVCMANRNCPGEYVLTGHMDAITNAGGPEAFTSTDLIATASLVGGLFGGGGGNETQSALVRIAARDRYGAVAGDEVWRAFRAQNDPEAVLTLHNGQSFPYGAASDDAASVVLPDPGTAVAEPVITNPTGSATVAVGNDSSDIAASLAGLTIGPSARGMSNAVVISAANSATGHPIGVFGPQTGYFSPQLLMVQELQGPGISARGAAFAGLNLYVLLGRGQDYAWSATSSTHDITDTYAVALCEPGGGAPTMNSRHYVYHGGCLPMEELAHSNAWTPSTADSTAAGSYRLVTYRTNYGLVRWRARVGGVPHAFTELRSTYRHEADSAIGFQMFNDPTAMGSASQFFQAAAEVDYAFNWFFVNSSESASYTAGLNPLRAPGSNPNLPMSTAYEWVGFEPLGNTASYASAASHPQAVDQDYFVSWNNKQAKDFSAADGNFSFGSVQRADLLDAPVKAAVAAGGKLGRSDVVAIMESAAVTDLRGLRVLDDLIRVIRSAAVTDPGLDTVVNQLTAWQQAGARRVETSAGSKTYQHAAAIRIFDAWWPLLVSAQFKPGLGDALYQSLVNTLQVNESPSGRQSGDVSNLPISANESVTHKGSSFQYGWWGYVDKDIRSVLGDPVAGGLGRTFCGGGVLSACRTTLLSTLQAAAAQPASTVYPGDEHCSAGDQWCADAIVQSPLGGITSPLVAWQNRPTYQQVVSFPAKRGTSVANLAAGRPVSATASQLFYPASNVVDGNPATRWGSDWSDNQAITVDLGSATTVGRVILRWEAAYGRAYRIETSTNGSSWTTVFSTATGNGGTDNDAFTPTTARYVRMTGVSRATTYGYSLYEFEVYRS